jgi:hypothetical protein
VTSEREQTATAQKRGADANGLTPERKAAVQPDGQVASQQTGEVFVDCGAAPFNFDEKNDLNYFVRTIAPQGEQRFYWGKDLPRALEEAEAKIGESITATRVASKPVTVEEIQEQPDGSRQTVRIDAKRNSWQVDNHGVTIVRQFSGHFRGVPLAGAAHSAAISPKSRRVAMDGFITERISFASV